MPSSAATCRALDIDGWFQSDPENGSEDVPTVDQPLPRDYNAGELARPSDLRRGAFHQSRISNVILSINKPSSGSQNKATSRHGLTRRPD
jgi:hypothetical protein